MFEIIETARAGVISDAPTFANIGQKILSFLLSVVGIIAIIMTLINGIKYFLAFGNESQMKSAKKSFMVWTTGVLLALGAFILINFLGQFFV
jgi:TRAP-type C4-dicarboxylate transport system permease small subunit